MGLLEEKETANHDTAVDGVRRTLRAGESCAIVLWGRSMWPAIAPGTEVLFDPCDGSAIVEGDVVLADHGVVLSAHRALRRENAGWWVLDDYWQSRATFVRDRAVLGRARHVFVLGVPIARRAFAGAMLPLIGRASRALGRARPAVSTLARRSWGLARRVEPIARARRAIQPFSIERLEADDPATVRRLSLVSSRYPRGLQLEKWSAAIARGAVHVAWSRSKPVAWARLFADGELELWIRPIYRGLGVGDALLERSIAAARERGLAQVHTPAGGRSHEWLERRGFSLAGEKLVRTLA